jgi:transcriptional regulator GlxA family with amidase domain
VRDYVPAHLDDNLLLTVLADIACLSPYHFSRSFKQAAGVGPQRYVIQRRVERAKRLLRLPFRINQANGMLTPTGQVIKTNSPCTIVFGSV